MWHKKSKLWDMQYNGNWKKILPNQNFTYYSKTKVSTIGQIMLQNTLLTKKYYIPDLKLDSICHTLYHGLSVRVYWSYPVTGTYRQTLVRYADVTWYGYFHLINTCSDNLLTYVITYIHTHILAVLTLHIYLRIYVRTIVTYTSW